MRLFGPTLALALAAACTSPNPYKAKPPVTCTPGQYVSMPATRTAVEVCGACASGSFTSSNDSETCTTWTTCAPGTFTITTPSASQDRNCLTCPDDTYAPVANQLKCLPADVCAAGTVLSVSPTSTTDTVCDPCGPGHYCPGGTDGEEGCPDGTWDDDASAATPCVDRSQCGAGTVIVSNGDSRHDRTCSSCPAGSFSEAMNATGCTAYETCSAPDAFVTEDGTTTTDRMCGVCPDPTFSSVDDSPTCDVACRDTMPPITLSTDTNMQLAFASCTAQSCKLSLDGSMAHTIQAAIAPDPKQCAPHPTHTFAWTIRYTSDYLGGAHICPAGVSGTSTDTLSLAADSLPDLGGASVGEMYFEVELRVTTSADPMHPVDAVFGLTYSNSTQSTTSTPVCP